METDNDNNNNNNRTPLRVVQLFIDNMNKIFEQNQRSLDVCNEEIRNLTGQLTQTVTLLNQNPSNQEIQKAIEENTTTTLKMITIVKTACTILLISVGLAVFGSQLLFSMSSKSIKKEMKEYIQEKGISESMKGALREEGLTHPQTLDKLDKIIELLETHRHETE